MTEDGFDLSHPTLSEQFLFSPLHRATRGIPRPNAVLPTETAGNLTWWSRRALRATPALFSPPAERGVPLEETQQCIIITTTIRITVRAHHIAVRRQRACRHPACFCQVASSLLGTLCRETSILIKGLIPPAKQTQAVPNSPLTSPRAQRASSGQTTGKKLSTLLIGGVDRRVAERQNLGWTHGTPRKPKGPGPASGSNVLAQISVPGPQTANHSGRPTHVVRRLDLGKSKNRPPRPKPSARLGETGKVATNHQMIDPHPAAPSENAFLLRAMRGN